MKHNVIVPSAGESITEVFIGTWRKKTGDTVKKDEVLVDLETQKASFELQAEFSGQIEVLTPNADTAVKPGDVIATIDDSVGVGLVPAQKEGPPQELPLQNQSSSTTEQPILSPAAKKIAAEKGLNPSSISGTGKDGRITKEDALKTSSPTVTAKPVATSIPTTKSASPSTPTLSYEIDATRGERLEPASRIRRQIAQNLVTAQHTAAILTTFNEVDMTQLLAFRKKYKESFKEKYGVALGIVSLFAMASVRALKEFPLVNSSFTGEGILKRDFVDISVAVSTDAGLVVPVVRDVQTMDVIAFEKKLAELGEKAKAKKLSIPEMTGGTFTISNGGVFGSLLSTPILNMPQSAILGLHKTQERPVVIDGQIVIRPMMYLALSYDHRIIDGREAVLFLVKVKEAIENLALIVDEI